MEGGKDPFTNPFKQKHKEQNTLKWCSWEILRDFPEGRTSQQIVEEIGKRELLDIYNRKNPSGQIAGDFVRNKTKFFRFKEGVWTIRPYYMKWREENPEEAAKLEEGLENKKLSKAGRPPGSASKESSPKREPKKRETRERPSSTRNSQKQSTPQSKKMEKTVTGQRQKSTVKVEQNVDTEEQPKGNALVGKKALCIIYLQVKGQTASLLKMKKPKQVLDVEEPLSVEQIEVQGRRKLRTQIRHFRELVKDAEDNEDGSMVPIFLEKANELIDEVHQPKEMAMESLLFHQVSNISLQEARRKLAGKRRSLPAFSELLMQEFFSDNRGFDFKKLGKSKAGMFRDAPIIQTMIGPMQQQPKARNSQKGKKRVYQETQVEKPRTRLDGCGEEDNKQETDKILEEMHKQLKKHPDVPLLLLILNRDSYAQTVENLFTLAFLVRDSKVDLRMDKEHGCLVNLAHKSKGGSAAGQSSHLLQCVLKVDYDDWEYMKEVAADQELIMPHRTYKEQHSTQ
eukprot:TRINITY_DN17848_c1_g2_i2.p1 TRINITY_DN17848_c1_g2~~TRINITY_DN17848_c1_g2_i2.p1  ORF type:complete len:530 (-),score=72.60 TRINITY_DN17848_c1_g2_i2:158-1690(-)